MPKIDKLWGVEHHTYQSFHFIRQHSFILHHTIITIYVTVPQHKQFTNGQIGQSLRSPELRWTVKVLLRLPFLLPDIT